MPEFNIVFEKLQLAIAEEARDGRPESIEFSLILPNELDEINELRKYSAELLEPEPAIYTIS